MQQILVAFLLTKAVSIEQCTLIIKFNALCYRDFREIVAVCRKNSLDSFYA